MAPTLFNMMFSTMVIGDFHDCDASFRFVCKRFNLRWLQDKTKVQNGVLDKSNRKAMNRNWSNQKANLRDRKMTKHCTQPLSSMQITGLRMPKQIGTYKGYE